MTTSTTQPAAVPATASPHPDVFCPPGSHNIGGVSTPCVENSHVPVLPSIAISATSDPSILAGPSGPCNDAFLAQPTDGQIRLSRVGDNTGPLTVSYTLKGTAQLGSDYTTTPASPSVGFSPGGSSATIAFSPRGLQGGKTIIFSLAPNASYRIDGGGSITLTIHVIDTGFGCGPPVFTDTAANRVQTITVGHGLQRLRALPFPRTSVFYLMDSGNLPPGLTVNSDGSFAGTATRPGDYQAVLGACTPAFVAPAPPSRTPTCAVTTLTVHVLEPGTNDEEGPESGGSANRTTGAQLAFTGSVPATTASIGLFLLAAGAALIALAYRRAR